MIEKVEVMHMHKREVCDRDGRGEAKVRREERDNADEREKWYNNIAPHMRETLKKKRISNKGEVSSKGTLEMAW